MTQADVRVRPTRAALPRVAWKGRSSVDPSRARRSSTRATSWRDFTAGRRRASASTCSGATTSVPPSSRPTDGSRSPATASTRTSRSRGPALAAATERNPRSRRLRPSAPRSPPTRRSGASTRTGSRPPSNAGSCATWRGPRCARSGTGGRGPSGARSSIGGIDDRQVRDGSHAGGRDGLFRMCPDRNMPIARTAGRRAHADSRPRPCAAARPSTVVVGSTR